MVGPTPPRVGRRADDETRERSSSNERSSSDPASSPPALVPRRPPLAAVGGVARGAVARRSSSFRALGRPEDVRTVNDGDGRAGLGRRARAGKKSAPSIAMARSSPSGDGAPGVGAARASSRTVSRSSPTRPAGCSSRSRRLEAGYPRDVSLRLPLTGAARGGGRASFPCDDECAGREASARATCAGWTRRWRVCGVVRVHGVADGVVSDMTFDPRRAPGGKACPESDCRTFHALVPKRRHVTDGNFLGDARAAPQSPARGWRGVSRETRSKHLAGVSRWRARGCTPR